MVVMMMTHRLVDLAPQLQAAFGKRWHEHASLARYTAARIGGPADGLVEASSVGELAEAARILWELDIPFFILGGGSNILVSDRGFRGVVVINNARAIRMDENAIPPVIWAEAGASLGLLSRLAVGRGWAGLEWASGIPGTVCGAVVGNAGAHGGDIAGNLVMAEILHRNPSWGARPGEYLTEKWPAGKLDFGYRRSRLKSNTDLAVVLSAVLRLEKLPPERVQDIKTSMQSYIEHRRRTQPPGASMGSMFKNPPGDYAGRLIDAAGLKGTSIGGAEISPLHANFFINRGNASASDVYALIKKAQRVVADKYGIELELEIELVGEWDG
jgi:UDP-N-acetylmuramate dehydrogenase